MWSIAEYKSSPRTSPRPTRRRCPIHNSLGRSESQPTLGAGNLDTELILASGVDLGYIHGSPRTARIVEDDGTPIVGIDSDFIILDWTRFFFALEGGNRLTRLFAHRHERVQIGEQRLDFQSRD